MLNIFYVYKCVIVIFKMISVTKSASVQLKRVLGSHAYMFFGAKGGGCNGFKYELKPVDHASDSDEVVCVDDIPFVLCGKSIFLYIGTTIDWKTDTMGQRFVFENPSSSGSCGCGATFSVDD